MNSLLFHMTSKRCFSLFSIHFKNHYEALGVSPKATQADIKAAYYKLSMIHHPDRNQGCKDSAAKFQKIRSAYEVLGDYKSRRLYDRGLLINPDTDGDSLSKKGSSPIIQKTRPVSTARTPVYDYDEWSKMHYGQSFARRNTAKAKFESNQRFREEAEQFQKVKNIGIALFCILFGFIFISVTFEDHDYPLIKSSKK